MKKASYILLAMMLIAALFVSCKAEVIDDSDLLVNVTFSSDDNSKGLTWSRDFNPESYTWYYEARKIDDGPQTGTTYGKIRIGKAESNEKGLNHDVGPFSIGEWEFKLYGYNGAREEDESNLVYQGTNSKASLSKNNASAVKVVVDSISTGNGYILISKDIKLNDGAGNTFGPNHMIIKTSSDEKVVFDGDIDVSESDLNYGFLPSGSYAVTLELRGKNSESQTVVYSSTTIYINVYNGQTTTVGGSLDDVKVSTRFEADDGIGGTSGAVVKGSDGSTILTVTGVTPLNSGDTTVVFPKNSINTPEKATLKVVAYSTTSSISKKFGVSLGGDSPISGIDLSLTVNGKNVETFKSEVTVTTYVATGLVSGMEEVDGSVAAAAGFSLKYNGSDADQPKIVSYDPVTGKLVFTTTHFSLYYVSSSSAVAVNETMGAAYTSLKSAVEAVKDNETAEIVLLKDVDDGDGILIPEGNKTITIDFNGKKYDMTGLFASESDGNQAFRLEAGNKVTLKNGTITSTHTETQVLVKNYSTLTLVDVILDGLKMGSSSSVKWGTVLSCVAGNTVITGASDIKGRRGNQYRTVEVVCLRSDIYNSVSVEFDSGYTGHVYNKICFESEKGTTHLSGYAHSLVIKAGNFEDSQFSLSEVRSNSVFKIKDHIVFNKLGTYGTRHDENEGYYVLGNEVVYNETSDTRYTDFHNALTNSMSGKRLKFVLKEDCVVGKYGTSINGDRSITIDLRGKSISPFDGSSTANAMFNVYDGSLTIVDSSDTKGSIDSSSNSKISYCISVGSNGKLNVESGITVKAAEGKIAATGCSSEIITEGYTYPST